MATSLDAPSQHKQPSRKGKKAWRKHVDITGLQDGLEEVREQIIQGGLISEKPSSELFALDTTGSQDIQNVYEKRHKRLKVDEILAQRSAVPAVESRKRSSRITDGILQPTSKKPRISSKELDRLRSIAYGGESAHKDVVNAEAVITHDPWAAEDQSSDAKFSFLEEKKPVREPKTIKRPPVSLAANGKALPAVRKPEASRSYNPLVGDYANLLQREGDKVVEAEKRRLNEAKEEEERIQRAIAAAEEVEPDSDHGESAWESEWEGFQSEVEGEEIRKKRPERKTPQQRNRIKRRKEAERQASHEAKAKAREQQLVKIKALQKAVEQKETERSNALVLAQDQVSSEDEEVLRKKRFGKAHVPEPSLEIVLPDELQESLRLLRPEGNLLKDRFRSLMVRGKVETRKPVSYHKRPKTVYTEKWSYKDWKLK